MVRVFESDMSEEGVCSVLVEVDGYSVRGRVKGRIRCRGVVSDVIGDGLSVYSREVCIKGRIVEMGEVREGGVCRGDVGVVCRVGVKDVGEEVGDVGEGIEGGVVRVVEVVGVVERIVVCVEVERVRCGVMVRVR